MALIGEPGLGRNLGEWSRGVDQLLLGPLEPQRPHEMPDRHPGARPEGAGEVNRVHPRLARQLAQ